MNVLESEQLVKENMDYGFLSELIYKIKPKSIYVSSLTPLDFALALLFSTSLSTSISLLKVHATICNASAMLRITTRPLNLLVCWVDGPNGDTMKKHLLRVLQVSHVLEPLSARHYRDSKTSTLWHPHPVSVISECGKVRVDKGERERKTPNNDPRLKKRGKMNVTLGHNHTWASDVGLDRKNGLHTSIPKSAKEQFIALGLGSCMSGPD
ncbi:hypothetical protein Syun_019332 [Stephania yunnanensis]|uniref:Uncharacterized protein n=1 Tax=Stephania yunnanensis TaxID=152371 RepID=A0AAP0IUP2_9MAGN